ncbi:MAG: heparinase II/III family protein [Clostridia bacterium]|nr:heparinase II/III family protein [Clostridia bacterium]
MKIFKESGFVAEGKVLSLEDFRLMSDLGEFEFDEEKKARVIRMAEEKYADFELKVITLWQYRQYWESGVLSYFGEHFHERGRAMLCLGMAEYFEGKGRFTEKLCDVIWAILEESTWMLPQHSGHTPYGGGKVPPTVGDRYMHGIELASAYLSASMSVVWHYCKDILDGVSPIIRERMLYELRRRTIQPFISTNFTWSGIYSGKCNNWCPWNVSNVLLTTALVEDDMRVRERVVSKSLELLDIFVGGYAPDGGCNEGPTYWAGAAGALFDCLETLYDLTAGELDLFGCELVKNMGEYIASMNVCGQNFVNFADGATKITLPANLVKRYGEKCGSESLRSFGEFSDGFEDLFFHYGHPYRTLRSLATPTVHGEAAMPVARVAYYMPNLKVATFRESPTPSFGMFLAIKGGHNQESHNHNDVGNFVVYKNGKPVVIDVGVGTYTRDTFGPKRYTIWTMQSKYHNLAMFDGEGEMQGMKYASANEDYNEENKSYGLNIEGAYPASLGVTLYRREARLEEGAVSVTDTVKLSQEREMDFVFMSHVRPEATEEGIALAEGCTLLYDKALTAEIEEFDPVGMDALAKWGSEKLYRIHLCIRAAEGRFTFTVKA